MTIKSMPRHQLYEIDLEGLIAFCTKCGYTDIVVPKTRKGIIRKPICSTRAKEIQEKAAKKKEILLEERRSHPKWEMRHFLSQINPDTMTAVCSVCGPTTIWTSHKYKGKITYICGTKGREEMRKYRRARYQGKPSNPHALSQINEEAGTAICATCGPVKIEIRLANKNVLRRCINAVKSKKDQGRL